MQKADEKSKKGNLKWNEWNHNWINGKSWDKIFFDKLNEKSVENLRRRFIVS